MPFVDFSFDIGGVLLRGIADRISAAANQFLAHRRVSSLAGGHNTLAPELVDHLKAAGRGDIRVVVGGVIPPQDYDFLRSHGVSGIFGPGANILHAAFEVLRMLGHNLPPTGEGRR